MSRAFLIVLDSVGIGGAPDAAEFDDAGANTLGHIAQACAAGQAESGRSGPLSLPVLDRLGLGAALRLASGIMVAGLGADPQGRWGVATEISAGKDTPSGHWELTGCPVPWRWTCFPRVEPAFPEDLVAEVCAAAGTGGILGNCHAAGIEIMQRLGAEHLRSGWPICYTSADSVFQIAAHDQAFGRDRLYALCTRLAPRLHAMRVGRVIARPFAGSPVEGFRRTPGRRDYAIPPPGPTLLDVAQGAGRPVHAIGKIADIFSGRGIDQIHKGDCDAELFDRLDDLVEAAGTGSLTVANFVEFDSLYGHTRDVAGYARALEWFDARAGAFLARLKEGDLAVFTADHGNDPTWRGTDHTRERVPVLMAGLGRGALGLCGFSDVGASVADHLGLALVGPGRSLL